MLCIGPDPSLAAGTNVTATITPIAAWTGGTVEMFSIIYENDWADFEKVISNNGGSFLVEQDAPTLLWIRFFVPPTAPAGPNSCLVTFVSHRPFRQAHNLPLPHYWIDSDHRPN